MKFKYIFSTVATLKSISLSILDREID